MGFYSRKTGYKELDNPARSSTRSLRVSAYGDPEHKHSPLRSGEKACPIQVYDVVVIGPELARHGHQDAVRSGLKVAR